MGSVGSGPIHLAISCPHWGSGITGGLGSGLGGMRRWTEDSGTAVRTQVQDSAGTRGLTETLEITLSGHRPERVEGGSGSDPKVTLAITVCPLTHLPQGTSPSRSLEPDCHQGSGYWGKVDFDSCLHTVPLQKGSDAT